MVPKIMVVVLKLERGVTYDDKIRAMGKFG